jgi:hypothetical protein
MGKRTVARVHRFGNPDSGRVAVHVLQPPYQVLRPFEDLGFADLPFGSVAHAAGHSALASLGALATVLRRWPWVVPTMTLAPGETALEDALGLVTELRYRVVVVPSAEPELIVRAARQRRFPPAEELARYVALRLGTVTLYEPLVEQFTRALDGREGAVRAAPATMLRLFARYGPFRPHDWRALALTMRDLVARAAGDGTARLDARRLSRWLRRFLALRLAEARQLVGWEWVIEQALVRAGYPARLLVSL